ncbi:MAG: hypothetical protein J7K48_08925 [Thermococcus sp.]|nr:hypothetical protein [Thermococcus sp.]
MKRWAFIMVTVFIALLAGANAATAAPYWVKPGVYIKYAAMRYDPYIEHLISKGYSPYKLRTADIFYFAHNITYRILAYNDTYLKFSILDEREGYLTIGVRIDMSNVTVKVSVPEGKNLTPIWRQDEVMKIETPPTPINFEGRAYKVYLRSLTITGVYRVRKSNGAVFSLNGTYYGHTFLWVDTDPDMTPKKNETFVVLPSLNWTMKVEKVSSMDRTLKTYYGEFGPPVATLSLIGPPLIIKNTVEFNTQTPDDLLYDPATGLVLSPTTLTILISPDLAAIGIPFATFLDQRAAYDDQIKEKFVWAGTLLLYDTNAEFLGVQEVPFSKAGTPWEYAFYAALTLLGAAAVRIAVRRRG